MIIPFLPARRKSAAPPWPRIWLPDRPVVADAEFQQDSIADAREMIEENRIAEAWRTLTYWRFWNLVKLIMAPAAEE